MGSVRRDWTALAALGLLAGLAMTPSPCSGQGIQDEVFRVYTDAPRLFLRPQRLRLLRREKDRQSLRWQQLQLLMTGKAQMPEPGFANALYYQISGDKSYGETAIDWAMGRSTDLRQLALVLDWCGKLLSEAQAKALAAKLEQGLAQSESATDTAVVRSRVLAALALADRNPDLAESVLRKTVVTWWRGSIVPAIAAGRNPIPVDRMFALVELLHAIRDNLNIELRDNAPQYFKTLAPSWMLSAYPAPYPAAENLYRIPVYEGGGEPDLEKAALARAAGLSLVSYDTNALENQFLQGWLIQDRYLMRSAFGSPYEFLWANPYQPGLTYYHMPLFFHDAESGRLFVRSSWEDDAVWFGLFNHHSQIFEDGKVRELGPGGPAEPVHLGVATIVPAARATRFTVDEQEPETIYIIGLKANARYDIEVDSQEMHESVADAAGTLELRFPAALKAGVRIHPAGGS